MAKAAFCDIRDTLGIVDRKGHLVLYRPTSVDLLKSEQPYAQFLGQVRLDSERAARDSVLAEENRTARGIAPGGHAQPRKVVDKQVPERLDRVGVASTWRRR